MTSLFEESKFLFKYLKVDEVTEDQINDIELLFNDKGIQYFDEKNPLQNLIILKQIISDKKIYFSHYPYLNDPFECVANINYAKGVDENIIIEYYRAAKSKTNSPVQIESCSLDTIKNETQKLIKSKGKHLYNPAITSNFLPFGIFSLSSEPNDIQMWSYYTNKHRGVCIAFEIDWNFIIKELSKNHPSATEEELIQIILNDGIQFSVLDDKGRKVFFGLQKVQYSSCVVEYPAEEFMKAHFNEKSQNDLSWILTGTKHLGWSHEKEWRLVCFNRYSDEPSDLLPMHIFKFIKPCGIILGEKINSTLRNLIIKHFGPHFHIIPLALSINPQTLAIDYSLTPNKKKICDILTELQTSEIIPN